VTWERALHNGEGVALLVHVGLHLLARTTPQLDLELLMDTSCGSGTMMDSFIGLPLSSLPKP